MEKRRRKLIKIQLRNKKVVKETTKIYKVLYLEVAMGNNENTSIFPRRGDKMLQLNPYLRFNDSKCREAMNFYKEIFGGELTFQTLSETPMSKEMPADAQSKIMHATLKNGDFELFASDMMRDKATIGDNISLAVNCGSEEQIRNLFEKLKIGGEIFMPLEKAFWGGLFGMLTDKFGIEWMLNYQLDSH